MFKRRALAGALAAFVVAGCGADEEADAPPEPAAIYEITVGEFIAELQPEKQEILEALAADVPECSAVEVDESFVLLISAEAIDAPADAPLDSIVTGQC